MKIDLHTHTNHSDGDSSVIELLTRAEKNKVDMLSITDHNTMSAYKVLDKLDVKKYYSGKILPGVEITSFHKGKVIEILGYGVDVAKMDNYLNQVYGSSWQEKKRLTTVEKLKNSAEKLGLTYDKNFTQENHKKGESSVFFKHLKKFKQNRQILGEDLWSGKISFFRDVVNNRKTPFYIDFSYLFKSPKEIINFIHECGGKAFLAHVYTYKFKNIRKILDDMRKFNIDGIECYYALFSKRNCLFLLDYCKQYNLLVSAGSDFHGVNRRNDVGVPNNYLKPDNSLFNWAHEMLIKLEKEKFSKIKKDTTIA